MRMNGVKHIRCASYHPSSNGAAERFVRTFKQAMKAGMNDGRLLQHRLENFLLTYRTAPHATTNVALCTFHFLGRTIQTRLDLLKPDIQKKVCEKQADQKQLHDQRAKQRKFVSGQQVMVRNLRPGSAWIQGVIVKPLGPVSYLVCVAHGMSWKRHVDHLRARGDNLPNTEHREADTPETTEEWDFTPPGYTSGCEPAAVTNQSISRTMYLSVVILNVIVIHLRD